MIPLLLSVVLGAGPLAEPSVVRVIHAGTGYRLERNGQLYFIKGAGAQKQLDDLVQAGGNSIRTWGVDASTPGLLDACVKRGLTATVGFWLMKAGDKGFSYLEAGRVQRQEDDVLSGVRKLKDHPALLLSSVGNEVELGLPKNQEEAMWRHVDRLAEKIHEIDPNHPVMTVVADMWPEKMTALLRWCPRNRCPEIVSAEKTSSDRRHWRLAAIDPDGDSLTYELQVVNEDKPRFVGDFEQDLGVEYRATVSNEFVLPDTLKPGRYRAYVIVRDGRGGAAVWNAVYKLPE